MLNFNDFLGYARHESEKEMIIKQILDAARRGEEHISIDIIDGLTSDELEYIKREVERRF